MAEWRQVQHPAPSIAVMTTSGRPQDSRSKADWGFRDACEMAQVHGE